MFFLCRNITYKKEKKIKAQEKSNHARIPLAARQADAQKEMARSKYQDANAKTKIKTIQEIIS